MAVRGTASTAAVMGARASTTRTGTCIDVMGAQIGGVGPEKDHRCLMREGEQTGAQIALLLLHQIGIRAQPPGKLRRAGPGIGDGERMAAGAQRGVGALCQNAVDVGCALGAERGNEPGLTLARIGKTDKQDKAHIHNHTRISHRPRGEAITLAPTPPTTIARPPPEPAPRSAI